MKTALTIAGSDPSGGAGIQADIKTMSACGVYGMSAVTALTVQNTTGVFGVYETTPDCLAGQLKSVFSDIVPDAVKIGMVGSKTLIHVIADALRTYGARHVVLDPVLISTSGTPFLSPEAELEMKEQLFPLADVITPNVLECSRLSGMEICCRHDMECAAQILWERYGCAVVCKGGHLGTDASDVLADAGGVSWYNGVRIDNPNTHGTGCTFSSALACALALGYRMQEGVAYAKAFMNGALADGLDLGRGSGPLNHCWKQKKEQDCK